MQLALKSVYVPGKAYAVPRGTAHSFATSDQVLRVDTFQKAPPSMKRFAPLGPFFRHQETVIPVPGQSLLSESVEAIWQGLKIVDEETDFGMFTSTPRKRPEDNARYGPKFSYRDTKFLLGTKIVDLLTARLAIYLPSYLFLLEHLISQEIIGEIESALVDDKVVLFYDWDSNFDIRFIDRPFSHSAILASWFNGSIQTDFSHMNGGARNMENH